MIILDTNVISELMRPEPDEAVRRWITDRKHETFGITTITLAEIGRGLTRLPAGKRKETLEASFDKFVTEVFGDRILGFDKAAADRYGALAFQRERKGLHVDAVDLMIASIASTQDAAIATRNTRDFTECSIDLFDPWSE